MEPVSFTLNDFYFVINPFEFSGMNGVITMIQDAVAVTFQHSDEGIYRSIV